MIKPIESKKVSDVLRALFNGYCPTDDTLLEKLRSWLETSVNNAGTAFHLLSLILCRMQSSVLGLGGASWVVRVRIRVSVSYLNRKFVVVLIISFLAPSIEHEYSVSECLAFRLYLGQLQLLHLTL